MMVSPFSTLLLLQVPRTAVWSPQEIAGSVTHLVSGLTVAWLVFHAVRRYPWPSRLRPAFIALHVLAAPLAGFTWYLAARALGRAVPVFFPGAEPQDRLAEFLFIGVIGYAVVAGVSYATDASARAARAEAAAAQAQLATLRAQLHPHFLFNALHTVVQLIPVDPARATEAAELVADLLRTALEEQRDEVPLADEWRFASRYLAVEQMRFGDRLVVHSEIPEALLGAPVPAFALQTLVENAVRHGAAPRVAPTEITVAASGTDRALTLSVRNTGDATAAPASMPATGTAAPRPGTGLPRLREQLAALHGRDARITTGPVDGGGYLAEIVLPRRNGSTP